MSTFTTEDRIAAEQQEEQIRILGLMMNEQYNEVKAIISNVKQKPLDEAALVELAYHAMVPVFHTSFKANEEMDDPIAKALTDAIRRPILDFARAVEEAHGIK
jgi:signal transduction histidine kinase